MQSNLMISGANFDNAFSKNETESFHSKKLSKNLQTIYSRQIFLTIYRGVSMSQQNPIVDILYLDQDHRV